MQQEGRREISQKRSEVASMRQDAAAAKSLQSCRLCATPETAALQAPPSLGFSRQEHWSGLPFPSPMRESEVAQSCPTLATPWTAAYQAGSALITCLKRVGRYYFNRENEGPDLQAPPSHKGAPCTFPRW